MLGFILAHVRRRTGRSLALLIGVLVATTGFTVLTASTATSRLAVIGTVREDSRAPYQILVRPPGTRTGLETQRGLVRPNFLAAGYGGITPQQWQKVTAISGVQVAAPIAMVGYAIVAASVQVDVTDAIDRRLTRQVLKVRPIWQADRGLTSAVDDTAGYVYVTRRPVLWPPLPGGAGGPLEPAFPGAANCPDGIPPPYEVAEDGQRVPLCLGDLSDNNMSNQGRRAHDYIVQILPDGRFSYGATPHTRAIVSIDAPMPLLVAAVDPGSEAALVGLDKAVVAGRYLTRDDALSSDPRPKIKDVPLLVAAHSSVDEQVGASIERGVSVAADQVPSDLSNAALAAVRTVPVSSDLISNVDDLYRQAISATNNQVSDALGGDLSIGLTQLIQIGQSEYDTEPDGTLRPRAAPPAADALPDQQDGTWIEPIPWLAHDSGFRSARPVDLRPGTPAAEFAAVRIGVFDPARLAAFGPLTSAPLDAYAPTSATGADAATRTLLHNQPMLPSDNVGGYLATAPSVLMSLNTLRDLAPDLGDPISAVRVRVAGVDGFDAVSRERVRLVAENIARTTGLDVDIVFGSSPAPQTVALGAGTYGRPALRLAEPWSKLNVATRLIQAVDRKSAGLFALILIVCVLFLGNAVAAAVRDRHRELAILACLGWPRRRLFGVVLGEVTLVGLAAGALSSILAIPFGHAAGTTVPIWRSLLAVPVALALALIAGIQPAVRASRAHPASALAPAVLPTRRPARRRLVASMALANLWRTPGRTLLGGFALAVGVCALTLLAVVQWTFHGAAVGTVLGDTVALQVRNVDLVAVATTVLLGVFAVADVLYLNLRERAAELAVLQATGWSSGALLRLIGYEGAGLGLLGALAGAGSAIGLALSLFRQDNRVDAVIAVAGLAAGSGVLLTMLASAAPAMLLRRLPTASLLAEE